LTRSNQANRQLPVEEGRIRIFFEGAFESGQRLFEIPARLVIVSDEDVVL
jgi:hypothetical protein